MAAHPPSNQHPPIDEAEQAALEEFEDVPSEPIDFPEPTGLGRILPRSLLGRQLLIIGLILGVGNVMLMRHFTAVASEDVVVAEQRRVLALAQVAAARIDGQLHESTIETAPGQDAFVAWDAAPEHVQAQRTILSQFATDAQLESPAYTLRIRDSARTDIEDQPHRPHPDGLEFMLSSAATPYWRRPHTYRPAMEAAFFTGTPTVSERYADDHGIWVTGWAPVLDEAGQVVAVVGVDAPLARLLAAVESRPWRDAQILVATFLVTFLAIWATVRKLGRGLRDLRQAADRIESGDYATPIQAFGFAEVVSLARGLEGARRKVAEDMRRLEGLRRTLGRRLAEAAEQIGAHGRQRRRRYAKLAGDLRVSVVVGSTGRTLPARLVDLTYEQMVVGMRQELAPDIASGMAAIVTLETRDDRRTFTLHCTTSSVTAIDEMVHFGFRVDDGVKMEDLPVSVAKVLNQRKALRLTPDETTPVLVAVRRSKNVRPVATEVLDISSDGLKLILPVSLKRFSNWGTRMEVALRFRDEAPALRLAGVVRNCHATPDGRVAVGVSFDGRGNPHFEMQQQTIAQWVMAAERMQREARERQAG
jgi:HAMP domain-containing protein